MNKKCLNWRLLLSCWLRSHDFYSCDIYKKFKWHKQISTTFELQPHHTMRPLSVDKLNIVISRFHSGQTTCQISSSTSVSIGNIWKFILSIALTFPSPLVVVLSNSPQPTSVMQSTLLSLGRLKQQYKSQKHSNRSPTNPSLSRQCVDTSGELVWRQWWSRKSSFKHRKERMDSEGLEKGSMVRWD